MLQTTLAAELIRGKLLNEEKATTIFESETIKTADSELVNEFSERISEFLNEVIAYVENHPYQFIGESEEETLEKFYTFAKYAIKGYLQELAEIELILPEIVSNLEESEEAEDEAALAVANLFESAKLYALSKGIGALNLLEEIKLDKVAKVAGAAAGIAGTVYGAKKLADAGEEALVKQKEQELENKTSIISKITGNLTHGLIGTSDEEIKERAKKLAQQENLLNKFKAGVNVLKNKVLNK